MFGFENNRCDRCGRDPYEIGLGGCFCPPEREEPMRREEPYQYITPDEAARLRDNRIELERREAEDAERRQCADAEARARTYINPFFAALGRGDDLWGNAPTYRIAHGVRPDVADAIKGALQGWTVYVTLGCTFTGPGGRGEMESTYYDPKACAVLVHRPR